jgi:hypothetical protein
MDERGAKGKWPAESGLSLDAFVTRLQQAKESSELGNINLFPSDIEWLMVASTALRAGNDLPKPGNREQGSQQCACC